MPSGPTSSCAGQRTFGSSTITGPGSRRRSSALLDDRAATAASPRSGPGTGRRQSAPSLGRRRRTRRSRSRRTARRAARRAPTPAARSIGPGHAVAEGVLGRQQADALRCAAIQIGLLGEQRLVLVDPAGHQSEEVADPVEAALGQVHHDAADPDVRVVHPQAGGGLEDVEDQSRARGTRTASRDGAELEPVVASQTRCEAIRFISQNRTRRTCARGGASIPSSFSTARQYAELVEERGEVVGARHERDALLPRPVLDVLLDPRVQVADDRACTPARSRRRARGPGAAPRASRGAAAPC